MSTETSDLKRAALDWINGVRQEEGLEPLSELPVGKPGLSYDCVLAMAARGLGDASCTISGSAKRRLVPGEEMELRFPKEGRIIHHSVPPEATEFMRRFDLGDFPELIEEPDKEPVKSA